MRPGILTLTTDFGNAGPYVAAMKGIVLGLAPATQLVDVSHKIAPQNILEGAYVLCGIVCAFPAGTVHLAVVDPGVGTDRRLIAVQAADQWFVGPDNGLISGVTGQHPPQEIHEISNPRIWRESVSNTFHGRDILAPAAVHLLLGRDPALLGPKRSKLIELANFRSRPHEQGRMGEVIFRDGFGNLITNVRVEDLAAHPAESWDVEIAGTLIRGINRTYGEVQSGSLVALTGSTGWLEIAVSNGDASRQLTAGAGTSVWVRLRSSNG